jgi:cytochrome b6-f complex iron-sulfur subunit
MELPGEETAKLGRRDALAQLAAVGACACCAAVSGCVVINDTALEEAVTRHPVPTPEPGLRPPDGQILRLIDLQRQVPIPRTVDKYPIFLLRAVGPDSSEGIVAFDAHCPHARCKIDFDLDQSKFICPCHGSQFDPNGVRLAGPARRSLRQLYVEVDPATGVIKVDVTRDQGTVASQAG